MRSTLLLLLCSCLMVVSNAAAAQQSTTISVTGVAMDTYCIERGRLLDTGQKTLQYAHDHTIHCLVDVGQCVRSGYEILVLNDDTGLYERAVQLDDFGDAQIVLLARQVGDCGTCTGEGSKRTNFTVTVTGELVNATSVGDSDATPPLMQVSSVRVEQEETSGAAGMLSGVVPVMSLILTVWALLYW